MTRCSVVPLLLNTSFVASAYDNAEGSHNAKALSCFLNSLIDKAKHSGEPLKRLPFIEGVSDDEECASVAGVADAPVDSDEKGEVNVRRHNAHVDLFHTAVDALAAAEKKGEET